MHSEVIDLFEQDWTKSTEKIVVERIQIVPVKMFGL